MSPSTVMNTASGATTPQTQLTTMEQAGRTLEIFLQQDNSFPKLTDLMYLNQCSASSSGLDDTNYRSLMTLANVKEMATTNRVPLPPEIMEHFTQMQCHCMMGLFPEIKRAWITIDSDIYIWSYEHGSDLAFYDGLSEVILSVGLVRPKPNVFHQGQIKYLLVLTTSAEILVLGVRFTSNIPEGPLGQLEIIHVLPDPVFAIPTEGVSITTVTGTNDGRLFLGGRDGSLFEIEYRAERSWFGKRFNKKNHSTGYLSYIMPSFITSLGYGEEEPVRLISVDNSRHILYTLSERGSVEVWDLGDRGDSMSRVATASQANLCEQAHNIVKNLDVKCFRPLVHISALEVADSAWLHLVVVAQTGARLYVSVILPNPHGAPRRPSGLWLRHVRMPPGFAANSPSCAPSAVTQSLYSKGTVLLVTAPGGDKDELWGLSPDVVPTATCMTEVQTILPLDGKVWAVCEEPQPAALTDLPSAHPAAPLPPLVVRQHREPPRKFVLLTAQGAEMLSKLRPVDILRQLLADSRGADSEAVRNLWQELGEEQACATALVLACLENAHNRQMAEWASRAFFLYGGEPRAAAPATPYSSPPQQGTPYQQVFQPGLSSTPRGGASSPAPPGQMPSPQRFAFSAKHNALYLYVGRVLRPIWSAPLAVRASPAQGDGSSMLTSSLTSEDCVWVLGYLHSIKAFFDKNSQFASANSQSGSSGSVGLRLQTGGWAAAPVVKDADPHTEEKASLYALKAFVSHACEVVGLWKILCEHQFHLIAAMLDKDVQNELPSRTFMELLQAGHKLNALLINALINSYLGDCASVQSISDKLREVCPALYRNEDAVCSKANEMLLAASKTPHIDEKEAKLKAALALCKEVAPELDLAQICRQFLANQFYVGVLELCLTCASKNDPNDAATHFYSNNEPPEDVEGYEAYARRMSIYNQLTLVLDHLFRLSNAAPALPINASHLTNVHATPAGGATISPKDAQAEVRRLIRLSLDSPDQLLHAAVLDWMLRQELLGEIISVDSPSVETFLTRTAVRSPAAADLLWKYHEQHGNHAAAAKLLHHLATSSTRPLELAERVDMLARAVMCMRSDRVGSAPHLGVYLQELEDRMEVAQIQQKVLAAVRAQPGRNADKEAAILRLNSELLSSTELYEQFAEPLQLWECKLAIIHSSNHNDPQLVEEIWKNIFASEVQRHATWPEKLSALLVKLEGLVSEYGNSPRCFPLTYIVRGLEVIRCKGRIAESAFRCLLSAGVPYNSLLQVYETLASSNERVWALEGNEFHIIETVAELTNHFAENPNIVPAVSRKALVTKSSDLLSRSLVTLYAKTNTQELIARLKAVESRLKRLGGF